MLGESLRETSVDVVASELRQRTRRVHVIRMPMTDQGSFLEAVQTGLCGQPKSLPCRYFYDEAGSRLFEKICDLPEYYLTRTEEELLRRFAGEMMTGFEAPPVVVELGSGSSRKTRWLLEAGLESYGSLEYLPIDVSREVLEESSRALAGELQGLRVTAIAGDYSNAFEAIHEGVDGPKLVVFLGSSLGNYEFDDAVELLSMIREGLGPGDQLLLGTDMDKDIQILEAAYDDSAGVTAAFNLNLLSRINREIGGRFDLKAFRHRARYNQESRRIEMFLVSQKSQSIRIEEANCSFRFEAGEEIHTENSHKYTEEILRQLARDSGFTEGRSWSDERSWFRVQLWVVG